MARKKIERNISYDDVKDRYYVNLDYGKDASGTRRKETKTFLTLPLARTALRKFEGAKAEGNIVSPSGETLEQWLAYWMENVVSVNRAATTHYGYKNIIDRHLLPALGSMPLQKITPSLIQEYYTKKIKEGVISSNTLKKHHDLLKTAFAYAIKHDRISRNPIDKVDPPRVTVHEKSIYNQEQLSSLFTACGDDRLEIPIKLAGYLGLRREEICGLRWENIDFENNLIHIKRVRVAAGKMIIEKETKNRMSNRTLHAPQGLMDALKKGRDKSDLLKMDCPLVFNDHGYVVQWPDGAPLRPNYLSEMFTRFLKRHGLPRIVLHELRHTFASIANANGVPMYDIGRVLGHSTPSTTGKIYTHLLDNTNKSVIQKVADDIGSIEKEKPAP